MKSVLVMAGGLKRANPLLGEDLVLIRALRDSNQPKFLAEDIPSAVGCEGDGRAPSSELRSASSSPSLRLWL